MSESKSQELYRRVTQEVFSQGDLSVLDETMTPTSRSTKGSLGPGPDATGSRTSSR